jgi:uncharacterized membrane protein
MAAMLEQLQLVCPLGLAALIAVVPLVGFAIYSLVRRPIWLRGLSLIVRLLLLGLVVLSVCGLWQKYPSYDQFIVLAIDQSLSISEPARRRADAFVDELSKALPPDRVAYLPFAGRPGLPSRDRPIEAPSDERRQSDPAAAIRLARRMLPSAFVPHLVLLTDGRASRGDVLAAAKETGVRVSTVPLPPPEQEVLVSVVRLPDRVRQGERFQAEVVVESAGDNEGTVRLDCGQWPVEEERVKVKAGENCVRLSTTARREGWHMCTASLHGFRDELSDNNQQAVPLLIAPPPRAILVEGRPGLASRVAEALRRLKIEIDVCTPAGLPGRSEDLSHYDLVALFNVPAGDIPEPAMKSIGIYVRQLGGGLLVVGGNRSFTPGSYKQTPLENVLPVSSYVRDDKSKPTLAIAIVIDRSESMAKDSRLDMAKEATRRAVELLGPRDQVGVLAFEDGSRWVSPIRPAREKQPVLAAVAKIEAEGATNMYPALDRAYLALREAFVDRKHMIVLTDGLSQGADFERLAHRIADDGITISTLGLGHAVPGQVLADVARIGHGSYYACEHAAALPQLFAVETMEATLQGITEKPFVPRLRNNSPVFDGIDAARLPPLLGYAETQAKPACQTLLASEAGDPLLACWTQGEGRSAVFTSSIDSRWAAAWLEWPSFDRFWTQLARHTMRQDSPRWHASPEDLRSRTPPVYADELRIGPTDSSLLRSIAESTGGLYDPTAADILKPTERSTPRSRPLWPFLLTAAVPLLFLDVVLRRWK